MTVNDNNTASAETTILGSVSTPPCPAPSNTVDCIPADSDSHSIGTVRSAPDGTLWLGNGDGSDWSRVDPMALRTYDEQSFAGKIMHIDRNGMGLPGHAFCPTDTDLTHVCTKLYAKGLRNPFRFTLRPGTGPVVGDVGWEEQEEIDLVTRAGPELRLALLRGDGPHIGLPGPAPAARRSTRTRARRRPPRRPTTSTRTTQSNDYQAAIVGGPLYHGRPVPERLRRATSSSATTCTASSSGSSSTRTGHVTGAQPFATGWPGRVDLELGPGNDSTTPTSATATPAPDR